jgi:hypothetical protein
MTNNQPGKKGTNSMKKHETFQARILLAAILLSLFAGLFGFAQPAEAAGLAAKTGTLKIVSVEAGQSVTIRVQGMAKDAPVTVRMGRYGTKGANGTIVGNTVTSSQGSFTSKFAIPASLANEKKIAVRVEVTADPKQYVHNWFKNETNAKTSVTTSVPGGTMSTGSLKVTDVVEDKSVSIKLTNAPANARLAIWFDWKNANTGAMRGQQAGTLKVGSDGTVAKTIKMPAAVADRVSLRIRLQGIDSNFQAYQWFINGDDDSYSGSNAPSDSTSGLPYLLVTAVDPGKTVSVKAANLPAGEYKVLMDERSSNGAKKGIKVDTVTVVKNKAYTGSFEIPDELVNVKEISIRFQHIDDANAYAFTWFTNAASN